MTQGILIFWVRVKIQSGWQMMLVYCYVFLLGPPIAYTSLAINNSDTNKVPDGK